MSGRTGFFSNLSVFLAVIAAVLAVIFFPLAFSMAGIEQAVSDGELVAELAVEYLVESDLVYGWLVNSLIRMEASDSGNATAGLLQNLAMEDQILAGRLLVPEDWAARELRNSILAFYTWLEGSTDFPRIVVNTAGLSESMTMGRADRVANVVLAALPECVPGVGVVDPSEELAIETFLAAACRPAEPRAEEYLANAFKESLIQMYQDLPAETELLKKPPQERIEEINDTRSTLQHLLGILKGIALAPMFLLGVIMVLRVRSWKDLGFWWGIPMLAGGLLSVPAALLVPGLGAVLLRVVERNAVQPIPRIQLLKPLLRDLLAHARGPILTGAFLLTAGGLLLFLFLHVRLRGRNAGAAASPGSGEVAGMTLRVSAEDGEIDSGERDASPDDSTPSGMFG